MERNKIICGDWKEVARTLAPASIDCIITSPPYYGLRDYGTATWEGGEPDCDHIPPNTYTVNGPHKCGHTEAANFYRGKCGKCGAVRIDRQLGQEKTPEEYINSLVEGFRILRAALKDTGTLWVNIGDSYSSKPSGDDPNTKSTLQGGKKNQAEAHKRPDKSNPPGIKPKDLIGIPWMLAFALRADGWYLRQDIIWNKPNVMPESVTDRCTKSHEYIFLLSKSPRYYFDAEAIKENAVTPADAKAGHKFGGNKTDETANSNQVGKKWEYSPKRNKRSVWTVSPKPFKGAHFAAYPHELIDPCIMAATSERGNCAACGAPWSRILEPVINVKHTGATDSQYPQGSTANRLAMLRQAASEQGGEYTGEKKTVGWEPTCKCGISETVPAIVYDPFMGSGTTASAAKSLGRDYQGSELNPDYMPINEKRRRDELGLFNT